MTAVKTNSEASGGTELTISLPQSSSLLSDAILGDSISVNGVCLTATTLSPDATLPSFTVGVAPETLRVTNLGDLGVSSRVNLERAVRADTRLGGHFVQGHVDCVADVVSVVPDGEALTFRLKPRRADVLRYVVRKGFVALDGTSLTVTAVDDEEGWWEVMLISYTQERVVTAAKRAGDTVNVEVDVLAKYAEKSMLGYLGGSVKTGEDGEASLPLLEKLVERAVAKRLGEK